MIDINESDITFRDYLLRMHKILSKEKELDDITDTKLIRNDLEFFNHDTLTDGLPEYLSYKLHTATILRRQKNETFTNEIFLLNIESIQKELTFLIKKYPDVMIAAMVYTSFKELNNYHAIHTLVVWVVATITARDILKWPANIVDTLGKAILTMNISISDLQNTLAFQKTPLTEYQQHLINTHPSDSRNILCEIGVNDQLWLDAVFNKKDQTQGPMNKKSIPQQLGRLIQRADIFCARLAPRINRKPLSITAALQACYLNEQNQPDEIGSAIVKALGIYTPGSFVKLKNGETAIVTRRKIVCSEIIGRSPYVTAIMNKDNFPILELIERDTSIENYKIENALNAADIKLHTILKKIIIFSKKQ